MASSTIVDRLALGLEASHPIKCFKVGIGWGEFRRFLSPEAITAVADAFQRRESAGTAALDALEDCVEPLPEQSRSVLRLRYVERWSVAEIAQHLGVTPAAMSKTLSRLRTRLYDCVQRRLGGEAKEKTP